jgi:hypothetical protein
MARTPGTSLGTGHESILSVGVAAARDGGRAARIRQIDRTSARLGDAGRRARSARRGAERKARTRSSANSEAGGPFPRPETGRRGRRKILTRRPAGRRLQDIEGGSGRDGRGGSGAAAAGMAARDQGPARQDDRRQRRRTARRHGPFSSARRATSSGLVPGRQLLQRPGVAVRVGEGDEGAPRLHVDVACLDSVAQQRFAGCRDVGDHHLHAAL